MHRHRAGKGADGQLSDGRADWSAGRMTGIATRSSKSVADAVIADPLCHSRPSGAESAGLDGHTETHAPKHGTEIGGGRRASGIRYLA